MPALPQADLDAIFNSTQALWEELRGQRIFVTGGTGFFGAWLLESFLQANERLQLKAEMLVLTRDPKSFAAKFPHLAASSAIKFLIGDVRSFEFPSGQFPYVIHAATEASVKLNVENPQLMSDVVVNGTRRALEFAKQAGVKKFLLTSSGAVYGRQPTEVTHLPEDFSYKPSAGDPVSAYGDGKRKAEVLCSQFAAENGFEAKIARCFAFVGPHLPLDTHYAMGNFIRDALRGGPIQVNGDGTPFRSYLYAADLTIWLWTILFKGKSGRPYNVGSDQVVSISDVADLVAASVNGISSIAVQVKEKAIPGKAAERYVPSIRRATDELGLHVQVDLAEGIRRTASWYSPAFIPKG